MPKFCVRIGFNMIVEASNPYNAEEIAWNILQAQCLNLPDEYEDDSIQINSKPYEVREK